MKNILLLLLAISTSISYANMEQDTLLKYPLKSVEKYCRDNPDKYVSKTTYEYNDLHQITRTVRGHGRGEYMVNYQYNELGLLISKANASDDKDGRTRIYEYNKSNQLIFEGNDDDSGITNRYTYSSDGNMIKNYTTCTYNKFEYEFKYDEFGRMIEKSENGNILESYFYDANMLSKKILYNRVRNKEISYEYGEKGELRIIKEDGKVLEEFSYKNNRVVEKRSSYYGKDPCYYFCCMKYITKYTYYAESNESADVKRFMAALADQTKLINRFL